MSLAEPQNRAVSQQPFITTVIPTYRRAKLLRRAIQSVLNQTYPHFRACVYDNASGDETEAVVAEIMRRDPRVYYHRHAENIGLERNFAYGAAQVATPFLNFLSDDDLLLPKFFETAMNAFERHPSSAMFVGGLIYVTRNGTAATDRARPWKRPFYAPPSAFFEWVGTWLSWTSVVFRTGAVDSLGGIDSSIGESLDHDVLVRITSRYPVAAHGTPCAAFSVGGASGEVSVRRHFEQYLKIMAKIEADISLDPAVRRNIVLALRESTAVHSFRWGLISSALLGRLDDARTAADLLRRFSPAKARLAALFGSDSVAGRVSRAAFRAARAIRFPAMKLARYRNRQRLYAVVQEALAATSEGACRTTQEPSRIE